MLLVLRFLRRGGVAERIGRYWPTLLHIRKAHSVLVPANLAVLALRAKHAYSSVGSMNSMPSLFNLSSIGA